MEETGVSSSDMLTIGDLMDLGVRPHEAQGDHHQWGGLYFRARAGQATPGTAEKERCSGPNRGRGRRGEGQKRHSRGTNPPLLVIRDRGNGYVLRRKIHGIHWEEAVEQLQTLPSLKALNASVKVDRIIKATVKKLQNKLQSEANVEEELESASLAYYVSWDLEGNRPRVVVDMSGTFLESVWVA